MESFGFVDVDEAVLEAIGNCEEGDCSGDCKANERDNKLPFETDRSKSL